MASPRPTGLSLEVKTALRPIFWPRMASVPKFRLHLVSITKLWASV